MRCSRKSAERNETLADKTAGRSLRTRERRCTQLKPSDWDGSQLYAYRQDQNVKRPDKPFNCTSKDHLPEKFRVRPGELCSRGLAHRGTSFRYVSRGAARKDGSISTSLHVHLSDEVLPSFLSTKSTSKLDELIAQSSRLGSVCQHITSRERFSSVRRPVPPLAEQERIVKLLDEADALRKLRAQADRRPPISSPRSSTKCSATPCKPSCQ